MTLDILSKSPDISLLVLSQEESSSPMRHNLTLVLVLCKPGSVTLLGIFHSLPQSKTSPRSQPFSSAPQVLLGSSKHRSLGSAQVFFGESRVSAPPAAPSNFKCWRPQALLVNVL